MKQIKSVMFVCHGNICRSPMAEMIMRSLASERGISLAVASSATSSEEIYGGVGNPIYPPAQRALNKNGIPIVSHRATRLTQGDLDKYDIFVCMDNANLRNTLRILGEGAEGKVYRLMDFTDAKGEVSDPWYTGDFDTCFRDIHLGCRCLLEAISKGAL